MGRDEREIRKIEEARREYLKAIQPVMDSIAAIHAVTPTRMKLGSSGAIGSMEPAFTEENQQNMDRANELILHFQKLYFGSELK